MQDEVREKLNLKRSNRHSYRYGKLNYKQAVLSTLAFFDLFEYPLTLQETSRYLFKIQPDRHHVEITLNESNLIRKRGTYFQLKKGSPAQARVEEKMSHFREMRRQHYEGVSGTDTSRGGGEAAREKGNFLPERGCAELPKEKNNIATRHDREIISKRLWKRVERFRPIFALTPYIRLVAVCNTLAINNASERSDIDLLVMVKPGRLFISRLILTLWLQIFGVRRYGKKIAGRFCLSFFTTEDNLNFEAIRKGPMDIYLAYWFQTLKPIYGDPGNYLKLLRTNEHWLSEFFFHPIQPQIENLRNGPGWATTLKLWQEKLLDRKWGQKLETILTRWQLERAKRKREKLGITEDDTAIILSTKMLKFHNVDKREEIYENWIKTLQELLKS